jgi:hypothetical protein
VKLESLYKPMVTNALFKRARSFRKSKRQRCTELFIYTIYTRFQYNNGLKLKIQSNSDTATPIVHRRLWRKIEGINKILYSRGFLFTDFRGLYIGGWLMYKFCCHQTIHKNQLLVLSWARLIHSACTHHISLRSILISSSIYAYYKRSLPFRFSGQNLVICKFLGF